jgi:tetratricopeptide (TPR) repeat protein
MQYKGVRKPLREIAQELGVDGVVEGSVMRADDRVRITAQLIDARSDLHIWSDRYDRDVSDVLALQSDVARAIAERIRLELTPEEQAGLRAARPVDPRAYDAYLHGLQLRGPASLVRVWGWPVIERFERAVELDPEFAEAWAQLAAAHLTLALIGLDLQYYGEFPKARRAAERALEIDERLAAAHVVLGSLRLRCDWDFPGARRAYERALELSPSDPAALDSYVWYLLDVEGKTEDALRLSERLLRVAPFDPYYRDARVGHFFFARRYDRALGELDRVRELAPNSISLITGGLYFMLGRIEEAQRSYSAFAERCGPPCDWAEEAVENGWAESGWNGSMRAFAEAAARTERFPPIGIAGAFTMAGETDEAFTWLERGYRARDPGMITLKANPLLDPLRPDPRFDDLLRRIGFPEE